MRDVAVGAEAVSTARFLAFAKGQAATVGTESGGDSLFPSLGEQVPA